MGRLQPRKNARAPRRAHARRGGTAHDLARRAVTAQEADVCIPPWFAFRLRGREHRIVFEHLPLLSANMRTRREMAMVGNWQR